MSAITISPKQVAQISEIIEHNSLNISYEINTPSREVEATLNSGALLVWKATVKEEHQFIDFIQDKEETDDYFTQLGLDMRAFIDSNADYELSEDSIVSLFGNRGNQFLSRSGEIIESFTLADVRGILTREILREISSAWMDCIRQAIEEVTETDPLSVGGIEFSKK